MNGSSTLSNDPRHSRHLFVPCTRGVWIDGRGTREEAGSVVQSVEHTSDMLPGALQFPVNTGTPSQIQGALKLLVISANLQWSRRRKAIT